MASSLLVGSVAWEVSWVVGRERGHWPTSAAAAASAAFPALDRTCGEAGGLLLTLLLLNSSSGLGDKEAMAAGGRFVKSVAVISIRGTKSCPA